MAWAYGLRTHDHKALIDSPCLLVFTPAHLALEAHELGSSFRRFQAVRVSILVRRRVVGVAGPSADGLGRQAAQVEMGDDGQGLGAATGRSPRCMESALDAVRNYGLRSYSLKRSYPLPGLRLKSTDKG